MRQLTMLVCCWIVGFAVGGWFATERVHADADRTPRFVPLVGKAEAADYGLWITPVCDRATGHLLYVMRIGGLAVVPDGCTKESFPAEASQ